MCRPAGACLYCVDSIFTSTNFSITLLRLFVPCLRSLPFLSLPFRSILVPVPFRLVPSRSVPLRSFPLLSGRFRSVPFLLGPSGIPLPPRDRSVSFRFVRSVSFYSFRFVLSLPVPDDLTVSFRGVRSFPVPVPAPAPVPVPVPVTVPFFFFAPFWARSPFRLPSPFRPVSLTCIFS